jgi:hypothetical protein
VEYGWSAGPTSLVVSSTQATLCPRTIGMYSGTLHEKYCVENFKQVFLFLFYFFYLQTYPEPDD